MKQINHPSPSLKAWKTRNVIVTHPQFLREPDDHSHERAKKMYYRTYSLF